jgi:hypothetical protein
MRADFIAGLANRNYDVKGNHQSPLTIPTIMDLTLADVRILPKAFQPRRLHDAQTAAPNAI